MQNYMSKEHEDELQFSQEIKAKRAKWSIERKEII
jgi:hypothetical protein